MRGGLRQAPDFANQLFPAHVPGFVYTLAIDQLRDGRPAGHRRNTALGAKANVGDSVAFQFNCEFKNVSASGVLQLRGGVGGFDFTRVSRVLKMVQEFGRIHKAIVMREALIVPKLDFAPLQ
jgi:hypothetical protein